MNNLCKKCNGQGIPSKALINTVAVSGDFNDKDTGEGATRSMTGPAKLIDCIKCSQCGHSWIDPVEKEVTAQELRIGNLIFVEVPKSKAPLASNIAIDIATDNFERVRYLHIVTAYDIYPIFENHSYNPYSYYPAPITPDFLIKAGFITLNSFVYIKQYFTLEFIAEKSSDGVFSIRCLFNKHLFCIPLHYIHQFQNLYHALFGSDLVIE